MSTKGTANRGAVAPALPAVLAVFLLLAPLSLQAADSSLPEKAQGKSDAAESVQDDVDKKAGEEEGAKRKEIVAEAVDALAETRKALTMLDKNKPDEALEALKAATGRLELVVAREPELALAPVAVDVATYDLLSSIDTVKAMIHDAENYLEDGEVQKARPLVAGLASEIVIRTTAIPLATYPEAIKAIAPLIDEGRIDEARAGLRAALNTLVITEVVIPLPILRAEYLLEKAEKLAEMQDRGKEENKRLASLIEETRTQLTMAELLGYGSEESFEPLHDQLDDIAGKTSGGEGGKGWFKKIREQISDFL